MSMRAAISNIAGSIIKQFTRTAGRSEIPLKKEIMIFMNAYSLLFQ